MRKFILLIASLVLAASTNAAVGFDAKMTGGNGIGGTYAEQNIAGTSLSSTGMTVGGSATVLVVMVTYFGSITAPAVTWNGTSMTLGPSITSTITNAIFYLPNPIAGNKTIAATWTGSVQAYLTAISFTGSDTITGVKAADNNTASATNSITETSDVNGATVAVYQNNGTTGSSASNFTAIFAASDLADNAAGSYTLGGTSNAHAFTTSSGTQILAAVHVIAPTAGGAPINTTLGGKVVVGGKVVMN